MVERLSEGRQKKVCIVFQEDGAGLHTEKTYLAGKDALFAERDWLIFYQSFKYDERRRVKQDSKHCLQ